MKTLVAFYSRTGHTRSVAQRLASLLNADLEELKEQTDRTGMFGFLKGGRDALKKRPADLDPTQKNPADYDQVIIGSPVWAFTICPAVRAYLSAHAASIKRAAFFCTHGGGGPSKSYTEAEKLLGKPLSATLALQDKAVKRGECDPAITTFVGTITAAQA